MRLTQEEIHSLKNATEKCFGKGASIWLFGSRVDDAKRGGDIDLYIETNRKNNLVEAKLELREKIFPTFGDQKIDIVIRSRQDSPSAMHILAKESGIKL